MFIHYINTFLQVRFQSKNVHNAEENNHQTIAENLSNNILKSSPKPTIPATTG